MMEKKYKLDIARRAPRPRSERLRELGGIVQSGGGSTVINVTSAPGGGNGTGHTHANKYSLDKISIDADSYVYIDQMRESEDGSEAVIETEKAKVGYADDAAHADKADTTAHADDSDKWSGHAFNDCMDQPVRTTDKVEYAEVTSDSIGGTVDFVDGLFGSGYRMWTDENGKTHLTIDNLTVRQTMVLLELLISKVRSVGGQICVSAANGKIKEVVDYDETVYLIKFEQENTFLSGDLIRCQTFSVDRVKSYWVSVSHSFADGILVEKREFEKWKSVPEKDDECVLMGSLSDAKRQNFILISATEDGHPRVDVYDGVSTTNLDGCLRARLGNLDGIQDDMFPTDNRPHGNGLYSDNVYLRGTFLLTTGTDVRTQFEITEGKINSAVEAVRKDFLQDKGFLSNPTFGDGMKHWDVNNETTFFLLGKRWIFANGNVLTSQGDGANIYTDEGRRVVRIKNDAITQKFTDYRGLPEIKTNADGMKEPAAVYLSFFYKVRKPGTMTIGFSNINNDGFVVYQPMSYTDDLDVTEGYQQMTLSGLWNGTGDFSLRFTGEVLVYMLVLSTDRIETLTHTYRTLLEQSERLVKISAAVFDKDDEALKETGLMIRPEGSGIYMQTADGKLALIGVAVEEDGKTVIKLTAENIRLEGLVTANGNFKVLDDGSIVAKNGQFYGVLNSSLYYAKTRTISEVTYTIDPLQEPYNWFLINEPTTVQYIHLPQATLYDGLELSFFIKNTKWDIEKNATYIKTADGESLFYKLNPYAPQGSDAVLENMNVPYTERRGSYLMMQPNMVIKLKSMLGAWYAVDGLWTGE